MARGRAHDDDTRDAVANALLAGQGVTEVAKAYSLPKSTVSRIKRELDLERSAQLEQVGTAEGDEWVPSGKVSEYLEAALTALTVQAKVAADETYLRRYPPQQLGILHGIIADKAARIIEAVTGAQGRSGGEESSSGAAGSGTGAEAKTAP
jgi:hypothetical protein